MGFLDKAKQMAEQAQAKLEETQKQFNASQQSGTAPSGPAVEYDKHGRPIPQEPPPGGETPPHGDPLAGGDAPVTPGVPPTAQEDPAAPPPPATPPVAQPGVPPTGAAPPAPPPTPAFPPDAAPAAAAPSPGAAPPAPGGPADDRNFASYEPPPLSSGDPLAG